MLENGFITLERKICTWRWFREPNTLVVFLYLILQANYEPHDFENITIQRGQIATSYPSIAKNTGLSVKSVRTAIKHLIETGEVAVSKYPRYSVYTVVCYDKYQDKRQSVGQAKGRLRAGKGQAKGRLRAGKGQAKGTNEKKATKYNKDKEIYAAPAAHTNGRRTDNPGRTDF